MQGILIQTTTGIDYQENLPNKSVIIQGLGFPKLKSLEGSSLWPWQYAFLRGHGGPDFWLLYLYC